MDEKKLEEVIERIDCLGNTVYNNLYPDIIVRMDNVERDINTIETVCATKIVTDNIDARLNNIEAAISNLDQKLNRIMKYLPDETKLCLEVMEGED